MSTSPLHAARSPTSMFRSAAARVRVFVSTGALATSCAWDLGAAALATAHRSKPDLSSCASCGSSATDRDDDAGAPAIARIHDTACCSRSGPLSLSGSLRSETGCGATGAGAFYEARLLGPLDGSVLCDEPLPRRRVPAAAPEVGKGRALDLLSARGDEAPRELRRERPRNPPYRGTGGFRLVAARSMSSTAARVEVNG